MSKPTLTQPPEPAPGRPALTRAPLDSQRSTRSGKHGDLMSAQDYEYNPVDEVEILPGLGIAVFWVVLSYVFVNLLLLPVHAV